MNLIFHSTARLIYPYMRSIELLSIYNICSQMPKKKDQFDQFMESCWPQCIIISLALSSIIFVLAEASFAATDQEFIKINDPFEPYFQQSEFRKITKEISNIRGFPRIINIHGTHESGMYQYARYFANKMTQKKKKVIIRDFPDPLSIFLRKLFRKSQSHISQKKSIIWILFFKTNNFPQNQIEQIRSIRPKDKIIVFSKQPLKKVKTIKFPEDHLTYSKGKKSLRLKFDIPRKEISCIFRYYQKTDYLPYIFSVFEKIQQYSIPRLLGQNYASISSMSQSEKTVLQLLCQVAKVDVDLYPNQAIPGVTTSNGHYFWKSKQAIFNYEIQKGVQCIYKTKSNFQKRKSYTGSFSKSKSKYSWKSSSRIARRR